MNNGLKVLIAYDGSGSADAALDDLTRAGLPPEGVEALVVTIAEVWLPPPEGEEGVHRHFLTEGLKRRYEENLELVAEAGKQAESAAERVRGHFPGWKVTSHSTYGSPAWEILGCAEEFAPDLIIVGAKGCSAVERVLLGSVSQKVVTEAQCSVRVARGKVVVDESPIRLLVGYDGSEGSKEAIRTISGRGWPDGTKVRVLIVEDSIFIRSSLEINVSEIKEVGAELVADLNHMGLDAELETVEGNPKSELLDTAEVWNADAIFIGATRYNDIITKYLLGSVSSAVVARAHCSVEVVRPPGYGNGSS
jgi:nucleotide-binding universal stress UspA family protein